jgi:hypothetical protein
LATREVKDHAGWTHEELLQRWDTEIGLSRHECGSGCGQ